MRRKTITAIGSIATFLLCSMLGESDVWAADSAGEPVSAGGSSGSGRVPLNRRTYLRPHPERDTLTDYYFGLIPKLSEAGIESTRNLWMLYQGIVDGGLESDGLYKGCRVRQTIRRCARGLLPRTGNPVAAFEPSRIVYRQSRLK